MLLGDDLVELGVIEGIDALWLPGVVFSEEF